MALKLDKDAALRSGLMAQCTKDTGSMVKHPAKEDLFMLMAMCMMAAGKMIKRKDMEFTLTWMALVTKDSGKKISSTEKVLKPGLMVLHIKVIM